MFKAIQIHRGIDYGEKYATIRRFDFATLFIWAMVVGGGLFFTLGAVTSLARISSVQDQIYFVLVAQIPLWAVWRAGAWPCVKLFSKGILIVNRFRVWWVPWVQIKSVDADGDLYIYLADGRKIGMAIASGRELEVLRSNARRSRLRARIEHVRWSAPQEAGDVVVRTILYARVAVPVVAGSVLWAVLVTSIAHY